MTALEALKSNDVAIQRDAFESLKAEVFPICYRRLGTRFPQEIDDVVIESMQDVLKKVDGLKTDQELTNFAKSIAEKKAISRWRSLTTEKRGKGRFTSIDLLRDEGLEPYTPSGEVSPNEDVFYAPPDATSNFHKLDTNDIQSILETLQQELKLEHKQAIHDFFIKDLSYAEISVKRGWPVGSVGVYVQRGMQEMRKLRAKYPQLTKEAMQYIMLMLV